MNNNNNNFLNRTITYRQCICCNVVVPNGRCNRSIYFERNMNNNQEDIIQLPPIEPLRRAVAVERNCHVCGIRTQWYICDCGAGLR